MSVIMRSKLFGSLTGQRHQLVASCDDDWPVGERSSAPTLTTAPPTCAQEDGDVVRPSDGSSSSEDEGDSATVLGRAKKKWRWGTLKTTEVVSGADEADESEEERKGSDLEDDDEGFHSMPTLTGPSAMPALLRNPKQVLCSWARRVGAPLRASPPPTTPPLPPPPPPPTSQFSENVARNWGQATDAIKTKVSETARAWSSTSGVPSLLGGPQHERLEGSNGSGGELLGSPSSPTLAERSRREAANLFSGADTGYQRLQKRKDSWGASWDANWGSTEDSPIESQDKTSTSSQGKKSARTANEAKAQTVDKTVKRSASKSEKKQASSTSEGETLLLDLSDGPAAPSSGATKGGHTWDSWDDDGWEKLEAS